MDVELWGGRDGNRGEFLFDFAEFIPNQNN